MLAIAALGGRRLRDQLRHRDLRGGAADMYLRDADLVQPPQAADLSQRRLKYVQVELAHRLAAFGRSEHELACSPAVAAQQRIHVLARQCRQAMVGSW